MSDKFSAAWWNEQAIASGGLDKAAVEGLAGMAFPVIWNADGTIDWDKVWPKNAMLGAPGLGSSGLLLSPTPQPAGYPYKTAEEAFAAKDPNWGGWNRLVSPVGTVAPGATDEYNPTLSTTYTPPSGAGEPDPWQVTAPDQPTTGTPVVLPIDPTAPATALGEPVADGTSAALPGVTPSRLPAGGAPAADLGEDLTPAAPNVGLFSTVSGKVVAVVALLAIIVYLATRQTAKSA